MKRLVLILAPILAQACASFPIPSMRTPNPEPAIPQPAPIPVYSAECRLDPPPTPQFAPPLSLPPVERPVERANAAAGAAIEYARILQAHIAGLAAVQRRCAGEERRNVEALERWLEASTPARR
jgi:hypothetical protein